MDPLVMPNDNINYPILILGTGPFAQALIKEIKVSYRHEYTVVGMVGESFGAEESIKDCPILGTIEDLEGIILKYEPERIVDALQRNHEYRSLHKLMEAKYYKNIIIEDGESFYEKLTGKLFIEALTPDAIIFTEDFQPSTLASTCNRIISLLFSVVGIFVLSPLLIFLAVAIKLDSKGSIFFVQERMGINCKPFRLLKFRTMHPEEQTISEWAGDNGYRITRVGKWLRKHRLDELPQFINVLKGEMNVVGPRPHPVSNYELFALVSRNTPQCGGQIPYYLLRSKVRPGITGWAQVKYQYANNLNEEMEKLRFDLYYVKHYSILLDIRILLETVLIVIMGKEFNENKYDNAVAVDGIVSGQLSSSPSTMSRDRYTKQQ